MTDAISPSTEQDVLGLEGTEQADKRSPGMTTQVRLLFLREMKNLLRDTSALGARFGFNQCTR